MLRLSNRSRYAVRAVFDLAFNTSSSTSRGALQPPTQVRDVAERQRIPLRFLEQIFQELKRAGLVFFLVDVGHSVERCFDDVTLRDLCARGEELGLRGNASSSRVALRWTI